MVEDIKTLLGAAADAYTDGQIKLCAKMAKAEVENYCGRKLNLEMEFAADKIAVIMLNRLNTEGLASQGSGGVSENYIDGYPADILTVLNKNRKIKVL